jgi:phage terminase large subunit GpA-like protein
MDAVSDPAVREVVVMKSAQVGWTEILLNVIGYHVHQDASPILLVQPTLEMAEAFSKDRLAPMVRDTPALRDKIADARARDSGNTLLHKTFPGGHITLAGANSPAGLASRPIRLALFDEVDRFPSSAGAEGDPISLGRKRTTTFWNRKTLMGSTPTVKGSSRIESAFESGDQRFYFVPCPHCDEMQRLVWANVRWDEGQPETAHYVCQHCGSLLTDADKQTMLRQGEWRASRPANGIASFHLSELYSPWVTWPEMARSFLEAKRLPETLQTFINVSLGECWEERGESLEPVGLLARRENYTAQALPPGVLMICAGTDVQDSRTETSVWGFGLDGEMFRVEHIVLKGDPGSQALWNEHDELLKRRYRTDDGRELVIEACAIDSGGHFTEQVYAYAAKRKRFRVWAIKGAAGQGRLVWPKKASRGKAGGQVYIVGVDTVKDLLYGRLKRVIAPGPGYVHFDETLDEAGAEQLTSETMVYRVSQGRRVRVWKPRSSGIRNEQLDCWVYAYAAMVGRGGAQVVDRRQAQPVTATTAPMIEAEPQVQPQPQPIKPPPQLQRRPAQARRPGSWVSGWKR